MHPLLRKCVISSGVGHSCFVPYHLWSTILPERGKKVLCKTWGAVSPPSSCTIYEGLGFLQADVMEYGIWNMDYGIWNMEYEMWNLEHGMWNVKHGIWKFEYGI